MRHTLAWIAGLAGVAALGRLLTRRRPVAAPVPDVPEVTQERGVIDPADELRSKLAEQRDEPPPAADAPGETLEERRARIHGKAQDAIDAMREGDSP